MAKSSTLWQTVQYIYIYIYIIFLLILFEHWRVLFVCKLHQTWTNSCF